MTDRPHRAYELDIHIGGDTWDEVIWNLHELANHIPDHGPACSSVSGSPSGGHSVTVTHRPEMTHEKYIEALEAYLESRRAEKKELAK
jgi:hypothetical protein